MSFLQFDDTESVISQKLWLIYLYTIAFRLRRHKKYLPSILSENLLELNVS